MGLENFDKNQKEMFYHTVLIVSKKIKIASEKADDFLKNLLEYYGDFESIFYNEFGILAKDKISEFSKLEEKISKLDSFQTLIINGSGFPESLSSIEKTSPVLYVKGNVNLFDKKGIAVVGTRELNDQIDILAGKDLVKRLVAKNYVVVSGLAYGCDTLAHETAIAEGGKTIAVLGTNLWRSLKGNKHVQKEIVKNHLLVSQYPYGFQGLPSYFAHRNKTTVGLATDGVAIIRSGDKSGTQHAVKHCLKQGKELYVLKNNLNKGYDWTTKNKRNYKVV